MPTKRLLEIAQKGLATKAEKRRDHARRTMLLFQPVLGMPPIPTTINVGNQDYAVGDGMFVMSETSAGRSMVTVSPYRWVAGRRDGRRYVSAKIIHAGLLWIVGLLKQERAKSAVGAIDMLLKLEDFIADEWRWVDMSKSVLEADEITSNFVRAFREYGLRTGGAASRAAVILRWFYRWCVRRRLSEFTRETLRDLTLLRLGNSELRGAIARHGHPRKGALDEYEQRQLVRTIHNPVQGADPRIRALVWVCWELGIRPVQLEGLRWRHLERIAIGVRWVVHVPRVKDPTALGARTIQRTIPAALGELLSSLRPNEATSNDFIFELPGNAQFAGALRRQMAEWATMHGLVTIRPWKQEPPLGIVDHETPDGKSRTIPYWPLPLYPYRLRRTLATRLAVNGASARQIAAVLGNRTLALATVYTSNASALVDELEKTLDQHPAWARLLNLFRGRLELPTDDVLPIIFGGVAHFVNGPDAIRSVGVLGRCASPLPCNKMPPLDCYSCTLFRISRDAAPHRRQFLQLRSDLESQIGKASERMQRMLVEPMLAIQEAISTITTQKTSNLLVREINNQAVPSPFITLAQPTGASGKR